MTSPLRSARRSAAIALTAAIAAVAFIQSADAEASSYHVLKNELSQKYITTDWGLGAGAPAFQWYNADWPESQWFIDHVGSGRVNLRSRWNGLCLDLESKSNAFNTRVVQMPCDGTVTQQWCICTAGDGYHTLDNYSNGLVMTVQHVSTEAGAQIIMWRIHGGKNQRFSVEARSDGAAAPDGGRSGRWPR